MKASEVKRYWDERAVLHPEAATTNDIWLRGLETRELARRITDVKHRTILDAGCGDGLTTIRLARQFPRIQFTGIDFSDAMIALAGQNLNGALANVQFKTADLLTIDGQWDLILTCRSLVNLTCWRDQNRAIERFLGMSKQVLLIENFKSGYRALNHERAKIGLKSIAERDHNRNFEEGEIPQVSASQCRIEFANAYFYLTRIVYALICERTGQEIDYNHPLHRIAAEETFGNWFPPCSPTQLVILRA